MKKVILETKTHEEHFLISCYNQSIWKKHVISNFFDEIPQPTNQVARCLVDEKSHLEKNMVFHWHFDLKCILAPCDQIE